MYIPLGVDNHGLTPVGVFAVFIRVQRRVLGAEGHAVEAAVLKYEVEVRHARAPLRDAVRVLQRDGLLHERRGGGEVLGSEGLKALNLHGVGRALGEEQQGASREAEHREAAQRHIGCAALELPASGYEVDYKHRREYQREDNRDARGAAEVYCGIHQNASRHRFRDISAPAARLKGPRAKKEPARRLAAPEAYCLFCSPPRLFVPFWRKNSSK